MLTPGAIAERMIVKTAMPAERLLKQPVPDLVDENQGWGEMLR